MESPLVVVAGPTGSGKSHLALALAQRFDGEIVNCDSLQVYRGLDVGTAKTPAAERAGIPHHLLDILDPATLFNAGDYVKFVGPVLADIVSRSRLPILAGGTGFYIRALLDGLNDGPSRDDQLRKRLLTRKGSLYRLLSRLDPATAARIHPNDGNKTLRALEICLLARRPASQLFQADRRRLEGFRVLKIGLSPPRPALHVRIASRSRAMFEAGLAEEVQGLLASGVPKDAKAFESIGYKECLRYLDGALTMEQAIELTTIATRQYAKRQLTWFRRESDIRWIDCFGDDLAAVETASGWIREFTCTLR
ncbi:tRNA (adenosine(37)-N6)-dimethylallyltransferase MiaA [Paludibaculum fermentans]|uniref:tRNA (adenosine(37)-N6)-dimethylallyltransferase MiaA n=1 Tax=Paludibaculum fermentans TaxID=1473598 RepID=UPI003EC06161